MQQSAEEFQNQIPRVVSEVMQHLSSTKSQRLERRIEELYHCLDQTSRVYVTKRKYQLLLREKPMNIRQQTKIFKDLSG